MPLSDEDRTLIEIIDNYCKEINSAIERFSINREVVENDVDFRSLIAFFIMQIGETANHLSDNFIKNHPEINWSAIINFRHHIVHGYSHIIPEIIWSTVEEDIPDLKAFCRHILNKYERGFAIS